MAAQSSLSHWSTVRIGSSPRRVFDFDVEPVRRAHSTGHTSTIGRSQITMPPECTPRCRGACSSSAASASTSSGIDRSCSCCWAVVATAPQASTCFDQASCWPDA